MTPELAELTRTIDPEELGRRIRLSRIASGLTQADLAGGEVTPAYISRIESGSRRPESGLLQRIAHRMGVTTEELLTGVTVDQQFELDTLLDHAELLLAFGDRGAAGEALVILTAKLGDRHPQATTQRERLTYAAALHASGQTAAAVTELETLTSAFPRDVGWMRAMALLARCHRSLNNNSMALAVAHEGWRQAQVNGLDGLSEATELAMAAATAHHDLGDTRVAQRTFEQALHAIDALDGPADQATAYLTASREAANHRAYDEASALSQKAVMVARSGEAVATRVRLRIHLAHQHLTGERVDTQSASVLLTQALNDLPWAIPRRHDSASLQLTMARLHVELEDYATAGHLLAQVSNDILDSPLHLAESALLSARIAASDGDLRTTHGALERAAAALVASPCHGITAQKWYELGSQFEQLNDSNAALDAFRRAGFLTGLRTRGPAEDD